MPIPNQIVDWLLQGDIAIQYQTYKDLLGEPRPALQKKILNEGWGRAFIDNLPPPYQWVRGFYGPKWISPHYTLLDLRHLYPAKDDQSIKNAIHHISDHYKSEDGGINPAGTINESDVCVNGMFMYYACYFQIEEKQLISVIDFILSQRLADGGFNCRLNRSGAKHSSLHSTISLLEGMSEYINNNYQYRKHEIIQAIDTSVEFILQHQLFISDRTGEIINDNFLRFPFPPRWKYDILRALDYFQSVALPFDKRMQPAINVLVKKRNKYGTWNQYAAYSGLRHFDMEKAGKPGRWNTLRALRVLNQYRS